MWDRADEQEMTFWKLLFVNEKRIIEIIRTTQMMHSIIEKEKRKLQSTSLIVNGKWQLCQGIFLRFLRLFDRMCIHWTNKQRGRSENILPLSIYKCRYMNLRAVFLTTSWLLNENIRADFSNIWFSRTKLSLNPSRLINHWKTTPVSKTLFRTKDWIKFAMFSLCNDFTIRLLE